MRSRRRAAATLLAVVQIAASAFVRGVRGASPALASTTCATPAKDGNGAALAGVVDSYFAGTGTLSAGATSLVLGAANAGSAGTTVAAGDLLLIVQMQNATIDASDTSAYGDGATGRGVLADTAGQYEYVKATSAGGAGATITFVGGGGGGLLNAYKTAAASASQGQAAYQVVRVPQYGTAAITGTLTSAYWNGASGGIVAIDAAQAVTLTGTIDVSGRGFRGGGRNAFKTYNGAQTSFDPVFTANATDTSADGFGPDGAKGEGIAGTPVITYANGVGATAGPTIASVA